MAKNKKSSLLRKFLLIALILVLVQIALIAFFRSQQKTANFMETAEDALEQTAGITDKRATQAKIQLAVLAFKKENGSLPTALSDLRPKYLDPVPIDPETKEAFAYRVDGDRFFVGETAKATPTASVNVVVPASEQTRFIYDPSGKRDPFRPFDIAPKEDNRDKTPLEQFDLGQFKLTAVLTGREPSASVELADGKGFIVRKGMKIGLNNGEIVEIKPDRIIIVETSIDFTGQKTQNTTEMLLRISDGASERKRQ